MRGQTSVIARRARGSWEYIVDVGPGGSAARQVCNRRFWSSAAAKERCPVCGGALTRARNAGRQTRAGLRQQEGAAPRR